MLSLRSIFSRQSRSLQLEKMLRRLSMTVLFLGTSLGGLAQLKPVAPTKRVYTYVEQMPQLPGGGGRPAIANQLLKLLQVPTLKEQPSWPRTVVSFVVGPDGKMYDAQVLLASPVPAYSAAMLKAVRALPRFTPGYQSGKPVAVKLTIPFSCITVR